MRPRVTLLTHVVAPYRVPVYRALARAFHLTLLYGGGEDIRRAWDGCAEQVGADLAKQSWGVVVRRNLRRSDQAGVFENHYTHFTPGFFVDLWRSRPEAVLTHEMGARTLIALLYGALTRTPVWVGWEGTPHTERTIGVTRRVARWLVSRWAARWISYGDEPTAYLESLGVHRTQVLQIQNAVDEGVFASPVKPAYSLEPRPVVLHAGRLVGLKNVPALLDAAAELQREGLRFSLLLVGDGPEREALVRRIADLGLRSVQLVREVGPDRMPAVYRSADVYVFPTLHDVWGLVVNEALWSGVPVLASRYAGCARELLPADQVFDPRVPGALTAELRRAITAGLPAPDTSTMLPIAEVAQRIIDDVTRVVGARPAGGRVARGVKAGPGRTPGGRTVSAAHTARPYAATRAQ